MTFQGKLTYDLTLLLLEFEGLSPPWMAMVPPSSLRRTLLRLHTPAASSSTVGRLFSSATEPLCGCQQPLPRPPSTHRHERTLEPHGSRLSSRDLAARALWFYASQVARRLFGLSLPLVEQITASGLSPLDHCSRSRSLHADHGLKGFDQGFFFLNFSFFFLLTAESASLL